MGLVNSPELLRPLRGYTKILTNFAPLLPTVHPRARGEHSLLHPWNWLINMGCLFSCESVSYADMNYMTTRETALQWGVTTARVRQLLSENRVHGVRRIGRDWLIPLQKKPKRKKRNK